MGIFQLPYVRKINKLHFFSYQILTFVFPTLIPQCAETGRSTGTYFFQKDSQDEGDRRHSLPLTLVSISELQSTAFSIGFAARLLERPDPLRVRLRLRLEYEYDWWSPILDWSNASRRACCGPRAVNSNPRKVIATLRSVQYKHQ